MESRPPVCPKHRTPNVRQTAKSRYGCLACEREAFRATLPPEDSDIRICPPGCTEDHDAGKVAGVDHWQPAEK